MIPRDLQLPDLVNKKSSFLFGPRSTGKSSLVQSQLANAVVINLPRALERRRYLESPGILADVVAANPGKLIVIDEVQLVPEFKSSMKTSTSDARQLTKLREEKFSGRMCVVSRDPLRRNGPYQEFITSLYADEFLSIGESS